MPSLALLLTPALCADTPADPREFFEMRIRPLLANNCFACHTVSRMGGLEMTSRESFLKGGNSGPAIVPGNPEQSLLIQAVSHTHERLKMPPQGNLKDTEIADLVAWVKAGAIWPELKETPAAAPKGKDYVITPSQRAFWSFQPARKPDPPKVKDKSWPKASIDHFILAKLEERGLKPVKPADKRTLIRRATYDLIGLPPTPEEVDAFLQDSSPQAFAKVVDRLLASPHYGERWGRYWLDVARYSDERLNSTQEDPYPNAFRYRDWVIQAFNGDMPFDLFLKAQIAGDLLDGKGEGKLPAGLGFYGLRPEFQDDRVDATTRGFLGLTVACAQCHDHKFDPIPTKDYYSLLGVFTSTDYAEIPLAPPDVVKDWQERKKKVDAQEAAIKDFIQAQSTQLAEIFAPRTVRYMTAAWKVLGPQKQELMAVAQKDSLDQETLERWVAYLQNPQREHPYLKAWDEMLARGGAEEDARRTAEAFQDLLLGVNGEKKSIDEKNFITLGGSKDREKLSDANLLSLERDKYFLWRDFFSDRKPGMNWKFEGGVVHYGEKKIDRFLHGEWKTHLEAMRTNLEVLKRALPPQYPFLHAIKDAAKPANERLHIRGSETNLGEEVPRHFVSILCDKEPPPFTKGSGRLELAEAIASPKNPLTARVMANRIWQHHFGSGIVRTPSNFGQLGERPSHPELLDYLAARFIENEWSVKAMHREIMLSAAYALSAESSAENYAVDPENRLLWRSNRRRLDAEALRDSLLFVSGNLELSVAGPPVRFGDENRRRAVYGYVSRIKPDGLLSLFDFPNPNTTSERRIDTNVPLQRLFFLNSSLIQKQAEALAKRLQTDSDAGKIRKAYRLLYGREPIRKETELGLEFLRSGKDAWAEYAQVLLSSNEFLFVD
ncbi:MAG: PSD1 domain-containing protein [Acidobacteria bacterium]|nr:PSD1 domain-containing protein [Acidobacteriota bacterium]